MHQHILSASTLLCPSHAIPGASTFPKCLPSLSGTRRALPGPGVPAVVRLVRKEEDVSYGILLAVAFADESDHHALTDLRQGHVVLEEGGEEEWST